MSTITRRDFMKHSAGAVALGATGGALAGPLSFAQKSEPLLGTTMRTLGKTGIQTTLVGMGTGVRAWNGQSEMTRKGREAFVGLLEHAYAKGIRFFDLADMYGSHDYMKDALKKSIPRDQVMILSKAVSREADLLKADLERFRKEVDTDYIDVVLLHCLTEPGWTEKMKPALEVMEEAKQKGQIKAHGVSCHNFDCMVEAANNPWVDVILARFNPFSVKMDNTPEEIAKVLKTCKDNGKGVLGMKIFGEGQITLPEDTSAFDPYAKTIIGDVPTKDRVEQSLRFAIGTGLVDAMTIGFTEPAHVDDTLARIAAITA